VAESRAKASARAGRSPLNEEKYAQIVDVAARLFAEKGFNGTSLQDISVEVGVLKGSLYHYITSKEDLLAEVVRIGQLGLIENLALCSNFAGRPLEQLVAFAYGHFVLNSTPERLVRGVVYVRDGDKLSPAKRRSMIAGRDRYEHFLRGILKEGQAAGVIDPDVDARISSLMILGVLNSYMRWYKPTGALSRHDLGKEFGAFTLAAVREHLTHGRGHRHEIVGPVTEECRQILEEGDSTRPAKAKVGTSAKSA
jgi:AcrR family transcriptional regulator